MKAVFYFLKHEIVPVVLTLLSALSFFLMGAILDILLTRLYARVENGQTVLPTISHWVYDSMAGHRFLAQEIMACCWLLMVICLLFNALTYRDQVHFRIRFIYSFSFIWLLTITIGTFLAFACAVSCDLMLARLDDGGIFPSIIHTLLLFELILIAAAPVGLSIWRRHLKDG